MSNKPDSRLFYFAVGNNIKKYRTIRNFSLQDLAERVGLTKKTIQRYENGEIKIDMDRLTDVAEALGVDVFQLIEGAESFLGVDVEELDSVKVPIILRASYNNGVMNIEDVESREDTPRSWIKGGEFFYVRATGDSMINARIHDGDLLLIQKQNDVDDGEIAAVLIDGVISMKKVFKNKEGIVLYSENPLYGPIYKTKESTESIEIIGKLKKIIIDM